MKLLNFSVHVSYIGGLHKELYLVAKGLQWQRMSQHL